MGIKEITKNVREMLKNGQTEKECFDYAIKELHDDCPLISDGRNKELATMIMNYAKKKSTTAEHVYITKEEMDKIHQIGDIKLEKIMFAFLFLDKKYNHKVKLKKASFKRMTAIKSNNEDLQLMVGKLYRSGYLTSKPTRYGLIYTVNPEMYCGEDGIEV